MLKEDKERIQSLVTETLTLLCKNGLSYNKHFTVNALIGVTLDSDKEFHFVISETVINTKEKCKEQGPGDANGAENCSESLVEARLTDTGDQETANQAELVSPVTQSKDSGVVHIKSEPSWESNTNSEIGDLSLDSSNLEQWCILDSKATPKCYQLDCLNMTPSNVGCLPLQQLTQDGPSEHKQNIEMNWQDFASPHLYQAADQSSLASSSFDYGYQGMLKEARRGRRKVPITDQRVARKILQCKGRVITVSRVQHFFNFGCRPSFNKIKEIMTRLEQQGFGVMQIVELENKKTKIQQKAAKAMAFVKRPADEVADLLAGYDISKVEYDRLYHC